MKASNPLGMPAKVVVGYVASLLATVAALMPWPFCRPLIGLLYLLMTLFFLFSLVVIWLSLLVILRTVRGSPLPGGERPSSKDSHSVVPARAPGMDARTPDLWDRWLDGI